MAPRFYGTVCVQPNQESAEGYALWAASERSTDRNVHMNIFCDTSKAKDSTEGGIAVTMVPWIPTQTAGAGQLPVSMAAWPVDNLIDSRLGEFLAVCEALFAAYQELERFSGHPVLVGKTVVIRIFNDNKYNLEYLNEVRYLDPWITTLARPAIDMIATQSEALHTFPARVQLELHWIPGHEHSVHPHALADQMAREAREKKMSFSTRRNNFWQSKEEGPMVRFLKEDLTQAS